MWANGHWFPMSMNRPAEIWHAAIHVREGSLKPVDLVATCLDRIDRLDRRLHAWEVVDRQGALAAASRRGDEAARGQYRGPLHGVPIGIKDIVDVEGMPTRAGSDLSDPTAAGADAPVVARLRAAGAIILGKTVTTAFAGFDPAATRNPWNLSCTPGGSSSGSAAAVASGMCLAALGSQTGGSLTRPAAYCGVASCKPTFGRVSTAGMVPVSAHLDHVGAIARCVADLTYVLEAMTADGDVVVPFITALRRDKPPRLGVLEDYFMTGADAVVARATRETIRRLQLAGAHISIPPLPAGFAQLHAMHRRIMAVDAATVHRDRFAKHRSRYGEHLAAMLDEGLATSTAAYQAALSHQRRFRAAAAAALENLDALLTPATPTAAPARLDSTGDPRFNVPWTYSGLPTVSFPSGLTSAPLPVAVQLIGRPNEEPSLLAAAAWCERRLGLKLTAPLLAEATR
jgi:aspartyl-tRNA(Asn)/glutamyl-tRNA(Gln) amidotransferase subunit A